MACDASFLKHDHARVIHFDILHFKDEETLFYSVGYTRLASGGDLFLSRKTTFQYGIRSIQYSGARLWNSIPILIRESPSWAIFITKLKTHFLSSYRSLS